MATPIEPPEPEPVQKLRIDNARLQEDLDYYRDEYNRAETALVGIGSQVDWWRRANVDNAIDTIQALLDEAARREHAWETAHVNAMEDVLRSVLHDLGVREPAGDS